MFSLAEDTESAQLSPNVPSCFLVSVLHQFHHHERTFGCRSSFGLVWDEITRRMHDANQRETVYQKANQSSLKLKKLSQWESFKK